MTTHEHNTKTYPLADAPPFDSPLTMGVRTGEFRQPNRGEWYLSGAIPECYQAPNDLSQAFNIVRLVASP